jgi:hypothetical protein
MMIRLVGRSIRLGLGMLLRHVLGPFDRATLLNDEQAPFAGHALQAMRAAIGELKPGARDQIPDVLDTSTSSGSAVAATRAAFFCE